MDHGLRPPHTNSGPRLLQQQWAALDNSLQTFGLLVLKQQKKPSFDLPWHLRTGLRREIGSTFGNQLAKKQDCRSIGIPINSPQQPSIPIASCFDVMPQQKTCQTPGKQGRWRNVGSQQFAGLPCSTGIEQHTRQKCVYLLIADMARQSSFSLAKTCLFMQAPSQFERKRDVARASVTGFYKKRHRLFDRTTVD